MRTLRYTIELIRYRPGLFALNCLLWGIHHSIPIAAGLVTRELFNRLSGSADVGLNAWTLLAMLAAVAATRLGAMAIGVRAWSTLFFTLGALIRRNMLRWMVAGPGSRVLPDAPGEAVNRFRDDADEVLEYVEGWTDFAGLFTFIVVALAVMFSIDPVITLAVLVPMIGIAVLVHQLGGRIRKYRRAMREATGRVTAFIGETFGAVQALKVAAAEKHVIAQFARLNDERRTVALKDTLLREAMRSVISGMVSVGTGIILVLLAETARTNGFTVGDFALFVYYLQRVTRGMFFLGDMLAQHRRTGVSFDRMAELLRGAPEGTLVERDEMGIAVEDAATGKPATAGTVPAGADIAPAVHRTRSTAHRRARAQKAIALKRHDPLKLLEVQGLTYVHPSTGRGIHDVNLRVRRGTFTVITGRIGSGKTTLVRVLLGLLPRQHGEIRWNGTLVGDPATFLTPPHVAYTAQVPRLFSNSLRENIMMGELERNGNLEEAIRLAVMGPDVAALEHGLDTTVGPRGVKLSGGQVQRSAAARMLARNADLLIFDDISSALDIETEQALWHGLFSRRDATCLVASHRRVALQRADHIIVLNQGTVDAEGTLEELLEVSEEMRLLWQSAPEEEPTTTARLV